MIYAHEILEDGPKELRQSGIPKKDVPYYQRRRAGNEWGIFHQIRMRCLRNQYHLPVFRTGQALDRQNNAAWVRTTQPQ
jgi:hypothetical protein